MKKTFVFVILLLSLFAYNVNADHHAVKIEFTGGSINVIGEGWTEVEGDGYITLTRDDVVITLDEFVNKDNELIGFDWMIEGASAQVTVKHGTTEKVYGEGTSGTVLTDDEKGVSNVVFVLEMMDDDDDDEVLGDDDEMPNTSDTTKGLGLMAGLLGFILLIVSKKNKSVA